MTVHCRVISVALAALLLCSLLARPAFGVDAVQPLAQPDPEGHGWLILSGARPGELASVLHLAPRGAGKAGRGDATPAMDLSQDPVRVAAWDDRVYFAFKREQADAELFGAHVWMWRVQQIETEPFGRGWACPPGRPVGLPPLFLSGAEGGGDPFLAALGAHGQWVGAILAQRERGSDDASPRAVKWGGAQFRIYAGKDWQAASLPWQSDEDGAPESPSAGARVYLTGGSTGWYLGAVEPAGDTLRLWTGGEEQLPAGVFGPPELVRWALRTWALPEGVGMPRAMLSAPESGGRPDVIVLAWAKERQFHLGVLEGQRLRELPAQECGSNPVFCVQPGTDGGPPIAAAMWVESPLSENTKNVPAESGADPFARKIMLKEISLDTGRELYAGGAKMGLTLVTRQYQVIAFSLVSVMIVVMLFVIRPDRPPVALPPGTIMASAMRRGFAAAIDLGVGALIAALVLRVSFETLIDLRSYLSGELGLRAWGVMMGSAALACTVGEGFAGYSLGKLIAGCMVVSVRPAPKKVEFAQALIRNAIRWGFPPLCILVVLDRDGRHPGDLVAGTAVVEQEPPPDEGPDGEA